MELVVAVVIPFLLVMIAVWIRFKPKFNLRPIPIAALIVLITGSVLSSEFFSLPAGPIPITIDRLLLLGMMALFGMLLFVGREELRPLNRADVIILALVTFITFSAFSHDWKFQRNLPVSRLLFFNLMPIALYWVLRTSRLQVADLKFIAVALSLFGVYLALTAMAEVRDLSAFVFPRYIMNSETVEFLGRGRGPFLNPVSNGIFQTTCFCCVLMWWPRANIPGRFLAIAIVLLIAVGVYSTLTRSVWLGLVVACGLFVWMPSSRQAKGAMIIFATIISIVAFPLISEKLVSFKRDKEVSQHEMGKSAQLRPLFAIVAWNMFKDQPMTGVGFGQYSRAKDPYLQDPHSGKPLLLTKSLIQHNVFLAYLTESGLIGLSLLLIMLLQMARVSWLVWKDPSVDLWARQFGLLALMLLAVYSINGMFHDVSIIPIQHMLLFFIFGLTNNIYSKSSAFQASEEMLLHSIPVVVVNQSEHLIDPPTGALPAS